MKKVYREKTWIRISGFLFIFSLGCLCIILSMLVGKTGRIIVDYGGPVAGIFSIFLSFADIILSRKCAIIIDEESIIMCEDRLSYGGRKLLPLIIQVQIKWEDIIALYWAEIGSSQGNPIKRFAVIPKPNLQDKQQDEVINFEVKVNKNGAVAKKYIIWLLNNDKLIEFNKTVKNYRDLLKEIHKKAPQAVIDDEVRRLIEKNE